jgi:hypothetical protein
MAQRIDPVFRDVAMARPIPHRIDHDAQQTFGLSSFRFP